MKKMIFSAIFVVVLSASAVWAQDQTPAQNQAQAPAQEQAQNQAQAPAQEQAPAQDPMQVQVAPGPAQPVATEAKPEVKPVEVKLDKKAREELKRENAAQRQAAKVAQRQAEKAAKAAQRQAEKAAKAQKKNPKEKKELKEAGKAKEKPFRPDFKSDFDQRMLKGNIAEALKKYPEFKEAVKKEIDLETQSRDLVKKIHSEKDGKKKAELEKQLRDVVNQHFDARQARRMFELKIFEDRIQELRKQTEARNGLKERIVEKRLMDLIGTDEDLRF